MYRIILLAIASFFFTTTTEAQTNRFVDYATTSGSKWVISKYSISSSGEEKKDLFSNYSFQFLKADTANILVIDNTGSKPARKGLWNQQDKSFDFTISPDPYDTAYYKIALLLNKTSLELVTATSSKVKFKLPDVMGQTIIELTPFN